MIANQYGVERLLSMAAQCLADDCPDLAVDFCLLAYRTGVAEIVAEMHEYDCPDVPRGPRWADDAAWLDWANLSLYHRAINEEYKGLQFFDDLVSPSDHLVLYGMYWVDKMGRRGHAYRVIMPDVYCHILGQLATREVYRRLFPALIGGLLGLGRWSEARRHAADHAVLLRWRQSMAFGGHLI